jgi:ankyrin repeat protein
LRTSITSCYNDIKSVLEYQIVQGKQDTTKVSKALGRLKDFLDVSALVSTTALATAKFAPAISGASIVVSKAKDYAERKSTEEKLASYKIFACMIESIIDTDLKEKNQEQIESFADAIFASMGESGFFEHLEEAFMKTERYVSYDSNVAREIAGSTLYISHEPFLFRHYRNIQDVSGILPKEQKDVASSTNEDVQNVVKYMIANMSNFGIGNRETDVKVIVNKIVSYFSTNALSLEFSQKAAIKIYQAMISVGEKKWYFDEEKQSLIIFQIKQFLRNEEVAPGQETLLAQMMKNPYHLKLLCRQISKNISSSEHPEMFQDHKAPPAVDMMQKIQGKFQEAAEKLSLTKQKKQLEFREDFINNLEKIKDFVQKRYAETAGQREWAEKLLQLVESDDASSGDTLYAQLPKAVAAGMFSDIHNAEGETLLMMACLKNDLDKATTILKSLDGKIFTNHPSNDLRVPLIAALQHQNAEMVKLLLQHGANVNYRYEDASILTLAIDIGDVNNNAIIDLLLAEKDTIDIFTLDRNKITPIHLAAKKGNTHVVQKLSSMGAELGHELEFSFQEQSNVKVYITPLQLSLLTSNNLSEIDTLLEEASSRKINSPISGIGASTLLCNIWLGRSEVAKHLIAHPKVKFFQLAPDGTNILHAAILGNHFELAEFILKTAAAKPSQIHPLDLNQRSSHSFTPMHIVFLKLMELEEESRPLLRKSLAAIRTEDQEKIMLKIQENSNQSKALHKFLKSLVDHRVDINIQFPAQKAEQASDFDLDGYHLLHLAARLELWDILDLIIDRQDLKLDAQTASGETILHFAARVSNPKIVNKILEKFQNHRNYVDIQNAQGKTALHFALEQNEFEIAKKLIGFGADLNIQTRASLRALDIAMIYYHDNIKKELQENIQKSKEIVHHIINLLSHHIHDQSVDGETYLSMATALGLEDIVDALLARNCAITYSRDGKTAVSLAASLGYASILEKLLKYDTEKKFMDSQDPNGKTPLCFALQNGQEEVAKILISHGANKKLVHDGSYLVRFALESKLTHEFILSFFEGITEDEMYDYLFARNSQYFNIADYIWAYGSKEMIIYAKEISAKMDQARVLDKAGIETLEQFLDEPHSFALLFGNPVYFELMTEEELLSFRSAHSARGSPLAVEYVLDKYSEKRNILLENGASELEANLKLKHYTDTVQLLYHKDLTFSEAKNKPESCIKLALDHHNPYLLTALLETGIQIEEHQQKAATNLALDQQNQALFQSLVTHGMDVDACDKNKTPLLIHAFIKGGDEIAKIALSKTKILPTEILQKVWTDETFTPYMNQIGPHIFDLLLSVSVISEVVNHQRQYTGITILHRILGTTALKDTVRAELVKIFQDHGADLNIANSDGHSCADIIRADQELNLLVQLPAISLFAHAEENNAAENVMGYVGDANDHFEQTHAGS